MTIRKLAPEERILTRPLYEEVFPEDSQNFVDYYYTEKTADNEIYVVEEDNGIRSMLHLNSYLLMINGQAVQTHYIVAVGTQEAYRGRGYMTALIHQALTDMEEAGEPFTFLMPAAEAIYLPHDFRTIYTQKRHLQDADATASAAAQGITVRPAKEEDADALAEFAGQLLEEDYQVYALRDRPYYERLIREYASDGGSLMFYEIEGVLFDCRIDLPEEETHGKAGDDPVIMARLVDAPKMLSLLKAKDTLDLSFQVTDPVLTGNNRYLKLKGEKKQFIGVYEAETSDSEGVLPETALLKFVFGVDSVEELSAEEGVEMSQRMQEELQKIRPVSKVFLNEVV